MSNTIHNELVSFILNDFDTQAMPFGEGTLAAHLEALLAVEKQDFFNTAEKTIMGDMIVMKYDTFGLRDELDLLTDPEKASKLIEIIQYVLDHLHFSFTQANILRKKAVFLLKNTEGQLLSPTQVRLPSFLLPR